jgi:hypothetical protein
MERLLLKQLATPREDIYDEDFYSIIHSLCINLTDELINEAILMSEVNKKIFPPRVIVADVFIELLGKLAAII